MAVTCVAALRSARVCVWSALVWCTCVHRIVVSLVEPTRSHRRCEGLKEGVRGTHEWGASFMWSPFLVHTPPVAVFCFCFYRGAEHRCARAFLVETIRLFQWNVVPIQLRMRFTVRLVIIYTDDINSILRCCSFEAKTVSPRSCLHRRVFF